MSASHSFARNTPLLQERPLRKINDSCRVTHPVSNRVEFKLGSVELKSGSSCILPVDWWRKGAKICSGSQELEKLFLPARGGEGQPGPRLWNKKASPKKWPCWLPHLTQVSGQRAFYHEDFLSRTTASKIDHPPTVPFPFIP